MTYKSFDANPSLETRGVFLDISKTFDKVWHDGLLYKLKCFGKEGGLFNILQNYLQTRKQRVVLNGQSSSWFDVNAGVPQGSNYMLISSGFPCFTSCYEFTVVIIKMEPPENHRLH